MIGIYFSGTGNTKYCLEKFVALYDRNIEITPLEDEGTIEKVAHHKDIIFAYPIYYSNLPKIVRILSVEILMYGRKTHFYYCNNGTV